MPTPFESRHRLGAWPLARPGNQVLACGVVLVCTGRLLGLTEIIGIGLFLLALDVVAIVTVWGRVARSERSRQIAPPTVFAGEPIEVTIRVVNPRRGRTRPSTLIDRATGPESSVTTRVTIPSLSAGEETTSRYQLTANRRGEVLFGPMTSEVTDGCGLAVRRRTVESFGRVLVHPAIEVIRPPFIADLDDGNHPVRPTLTGSDFEGIRDYAPGDDLRKVHWPTSARRDSLVVRHDALPLQRHCRVELDARSQVHDAFTFERAVSATASILVAAGAVGQPIRLVITDGFDTNVGRGPMHLQAALDRLASVALSAHEVSRARSDMRSTIVVTSIEGAAHWHTARWAGLVCAFAMEGANGPVSSSDAEIVIPSDRSFASIWNARSTVDSARTQWPGTALVEQ